MFVAGLILEMVGLAIEIFFYFTSVFDNLPLLGEFKIYGMPEWSKGGGCKPSALCYVGSNPALINLVGEFNF